MDFYIDEKDKELGRARLGQGGRRHERWGMGEAGVAGEGEA